MTSKNLAVIDGQVLSRKNFMDAIDQEIIQLHDSGDINKVMNVLNGLSAIEDISGHAKAKLLYASDQWYKLNQPDEDFGDYVESVSSTKKVTVKRYTLVWKYVEDLTIPKEIAEMPMRNLVPIAMTISQGYEIGKAEWRKISLCSSSGELSDVLRKIRGKKERKSARIIKMSRDGSLNGWKDNKKYFLGFLNIKDAADDIVLAEFIDQV